MFRAGDVIKYKPKDEEWLVAFERDGRVVACGWPLEYVAASDCELVRKATDKQHEGVLSDMAGMNDTSDPRCTYARRALNLSE